jgi:replicative DNA helicase
MNGVVLQNKCARDAYSQLDRKSQENLAPQMWIGPWVQGDSMLMGLPRNDGRDATDLTREPPHNIRAEQVILGAILLNNSALEGVSELLSGDDFFDPLHRKIYEISVRLIEKGLLASPVTLKTAFDAADEISPGISIPIYLTRLTGAAIGAGDAKEYARLVRDLSVRRHLIVIGEDLINVAFDATIDCAPSVIIEETEGELFALAEAGSTGSMVTFSEAVGEAIKEANEAYQKSGHLAGHATGLTDLDHKLGGLQKSNLIILAGRPSMGKTALATNIAWNVARAGKPVLFFSLEMSKSELAMRLMASEIEISSEKLRRGMVNEVELRQLIDHGAVVRETPLHIDDRGGISIAQLCARARRAKRRHGVELLVVDYLQLLSGSKRSKDGRTQEVSEITVALKALAKELNVPIIALSQLSRQVEQRTDKRPQLSDLRESGSIEQDADVVMFVYREEYYLERLQPAEDEVEKFAEWFRKMQKAAGKAEVIIGKQRHGSVGIVPVAFSAHLTRFSTLAREYQMPERYE